MRIFDLVTSAPLWIQAPLVTATLVLLCGALATVLLRGIDVLGGAINRRNK